MRFRTTGTTEYVLKNIQQHIEATGEINTGPQKGIPVRYYYTGELSRISDHAIGSVVIGEHFDNTEEFYTVEFPHPPQVGHRFNYVHPEWFGCSSSIVSEILEPDFSELHDEESND